ncbi:MAG: DUF3955 domain-containing protein [Erysipelotrichales bacterium]
MDFGEQIKMVRKSEKLTQEQFAIKLNVTRQAVSNWENNKNLPDIGMLILISNVFQISLDQLIKGEDNMNNITKKIINDGSETKKAKYNMITTIIGGIFLLLGIMCFLIKSTSVEYIDAQGMLHENFYLLPIGFLFVFIGLILFLTIGIKEIINKIKKNK